jgi:signal peptidase I
VRKINVKKIKNGVRQEVYNFFDALIICTAIIVLTFVFVGQPVEVIGDSMLPAFESGQRLLAEKVSIKLKDPNRGEVVIVRHPHEKELYVIKRIVGLPNETVLIKDGSVFINDEPLNEDYLNEGTVTKGRNLIKDNAPRVIPEGKYVVLGDNRMDSMDSRNWGFVEEGDIIGKAAIVYYPLKDFQIISELL